MTVQAKGVNVAGAQTAVTDAAGIYRFPALQPGIYEVVATLQGFQTARRIPGAASHTVESAGHFLSFDAPEDVIPRVVEFVDRLPARLPS